MIRLGLIGCGEHSELGHAIPLARYRLEHPGEIQLTAVCDLKLERAEAFCRKYGFADAYGEPDEMLSGPELDACIAVVPVERISEIGKKLLRLGLPCVIEKPLGASLADAKSLLDCAQATRTQNMVSVNRRFMPLLNRAIQWVSLAGPMRYVRCTMTRHARSEPEFLWATAVHAVDTLRYIAGNVTEFKVRNLGSGIAAAQWYAIDLEFENGAPGHIDVLPTAGVLEESYELMGEGFRAIVTSPFGPERGLWCYREKRLVVQETDESMPEEVINGFYDEAATLIRALTRKEPLCPSIEDVYPSVELCHRLVSMAASGAGPSRAAS